MIFFGIKKNLFIKKREKKSRYKIQTFGKAAVMSSTFSEKREPFLKDTLLVLK